VGRLAGGEGIAELQLHRETCSDPRIVSARGTLFRIPGGDGDDDICNSTGEELS
jgi:hypothetical protein